MFTLYIHILEVLAMHSEGVSVSKIVEMGCEYSSGKVNAALRALSEEGFVVVDKSGFVNIWQVTEKAIEYCETVARKYSASHIMDEIAEHVAYHEAKAQEAPNNMFTEQVTTPENVGQEGLPETITQVSDLMNVLGHTEGVSGSVKMHLYGDMTIAEVVSAMEKIAPVKVVKADLENGIVTLDYEPIPHDDPVSDDPSCPNCGQYLETEFELKNGACANCS